MACVALQVNLMFWKDEGRACQGWSGAFCSGASQGQWPLERISLAGAPPQGRGITR